MPIARSILILVAAAGAAFSADASRQSAANDVIRASVARQLQSVTAMRLAQASHNHSIQKQIGLASTRSFFLLSPPSRIGGNSGGYAAANCEPLPGPEIQALIASAAERENLQPELLRGIANQESGFRPCVVSSKGAMGVMQLMPETASRLGVRNPFNPKENVDAGARLIKQLLNLYGDLPMALGAYNAGPARVDEAGGVPNFSETLSYVRRIMAGLPSSSMSR